MSDAVRALAISNSHLMDVKALFGKLTEPDHDTGGREALRILALATKQLNRATDIDPSAIGVVDEGEFTQDILRSEILQCEGLAHRLLNDVKRSITSYKKALTYTPDSGAAHDYLAQAYILDGQRRLAIDTQKKAISLEPDNIDYVKTLDNFQDSSTISVQLITFNGSWKLLAFIVFIAVMPIYSFFTGGVPFSAALGGVFFLGVAFLYWRMKRGAR